MDDIIKSLIEYCYKYSQKRITKKKSLAAVSLFAKHKKEWESAINNLYNIDGKRIDGDIQYGQALAIYATALSSGASIGKDAVDDLEKFLSSYESKVKYQFAIKYQAYYCLGICWHKLDPVFDGKAIKAFKKYILYILTSRYNTSYRAICYSFRPCSTFLYQSLINDTLNLSSPKQFNDPFDCPILSLLETGGDIEQLIRIAYQDCVKVACFTNNTKLPYTAEDVHFIHGEKKHVSDKTEYLNPLMWAHYANSHKGICIRYRFPNELTQFGTVSDSPYFCFLKDIEYNDEIPASKGSIRIDDSFFTKGKCWEYDNELRLFYYNPNDSNPYVAVSANNTIEAIYFGLECSSKDRETIINILKDRKCVWYNEKYDGKKKRTIKIFHRKKIQFYQIEKDSKHLGKLIAKMIVVE